MSWENFFPVVSEHPILLQHLTGSVSVIICTLLPTAAAEPLFSSVISPSLYGCLRESGFITSLLEQLNVFYAD